MTVAVKPVSVALALCWHAGSRLTRLGTSLMRVAAEHGHVPSITDEDAARMSPETPGEAKARMRGDYQDWTSAIRADMGRGKSATLTVPIGDLLPDSDDDWPDGLGQRLQARQSLVDQQANPTWMDDVEHTCSFGTPYASLTCCGGNVFACVNCRGDRECHAALCPDDSHRVRRATRVAAVAHMERVLDED